MAEFDHVQTASISAQERVMPQNIDAERAVLAAMILSPDVLEELIPKVTSSAAFYRPAHRKIFESLIELYEAGTPIDQLSLADRLAARGQLEEVGGKPYIIELANNSFALANWAHHVDIVIRCALLRDMVAAGTKITALAYDAPDDTKAVVEDAEKLIFQVTDRQISKSFIKMDKLLMDSFNDLEALADSKAHLVGVTTGFTDLDNLLAGLREGSLTVIAARPGMGKSSFALNVGVNAAKAGAAVAIFSLEMAASEIMPRIIASEANISLARMRSGRLVEGDWLQITNAADALSGLEFWIDDTPSLSILEMRAKARRQLHRREGNGLIIVDYLQLMQPQGRRSENRQVEIAEISRGLKVLAKELHVPVIALSQLSRAVESRTGRVPQLSDLRESGAIEQDADIVMFIDRSKDEDEAGQKDRPDPNVANIIVAKNRNGATGKVDLVWLPESTKFSDPYYREI